MDSIGVVQGRENRMPVNNIEIRTENLTKIYGTLTALDNLNVEVERGYIFGYLGPNGSGKTTTVRLLSGLLRPTSGTATLCGYDIVSDLKKVKAVTGILPETPGLYTKLSAVEFLEFIGALYDVEKEKLHERIMKILSILGLEDRQDDLLDSYSSGMKQKVLVASTLIHEPKIVFLDEPTAYLDPSTSVLVKDIILTLAKETGTTFFICTHMIDFAEKVCDKIGLLKAGKLMTVGTVQEIVEKSKTQNLEEAYLKIMGEENAIEGILDWRG